MAFVDPDEQESKGPKFSDPDESAVSGALKSDWLKKGAPFYLGPLGIPRAIRDSSQALDRAGFSAGAAVNDFARESGASNEVAAGLGAATNVGIQSIPMVPAGALGTMASKLFDKAAHSLMHSALKPSSISPKKGDAAVHTMLERGYNVSSGGLDSMRKRITGLNAEVAADIAPSTGKVNKSDVAAYTQDAVKKFENRPEAVQAIDAAIEAEKKFINHPMQTSGATMTVQDAQSMKQGYQASIGERGYGELKTPATEMDKAIARGLREKVAQEVPSVAPKLAEEAELINAAKRLQHRMAVEANKNPLGLGALITQPWMMPVWMWDRSALGKSMLARQLYEGQTGIPALLSAGGVRGAQAIPSGALYPQE
jgi:hypothetical protein